MANAIIYFNSKVLINLLESFERQGKDELTDTIKRASPVAWRNINFREKYLFVGEGEAPDIEGLMASIEDDIPNPDKSYPLQANKQGRLQRSCPFWTENPRNPNNI